MARYALRRILTAIPLLLGVATIVFLILNLAPGDPASLYFSPTMSPETLEQVRRNMGLDEPLLVRYLHWLGAFVQGDFQLSLTQSIPVADLIRGRLLNTFVLAGAALVLSFAIGIVLGVVQAVRHNSVVDSGLSTVTLFFYSMPSFWLAIMLVLVFSVNAVTNWNWPVSFPASGVTSVDHDLMGPLGQLMDRIRHLVLPLTTLVLVLTAGISRYVRAGMLEVLGQDYVRTARAKGLPESRVVFKHAFRNSLITLVTLVGGMVPALVGGSVIVEYIFSIEGMGRLAFDAILSRDYPVIMAVTTLSALLTLAGVLVSDLLYGAVDPRVRQHR